MTGSPLVLTAILVSFLSQAGVELATAWQRRRLGGSRREVRTLAIGGLLTMLLLLACAVAEADTGSAHLLAGIVLATFVLHAVNKAVYRRHRNGARR